MRRGSLAAWLSEALDLNEIVLPKGYRDKAEALQELQKVVRRCAKCELYKTRRNYVFGEGNPYADLMFVGEAPGGEEDKHGRPFVGRAGKLLTELLSEIGLSRDEVYIANVLKCRPPRNRDPKPDEIKACSPYLDKQIKIIQPRLLVALGRFAAFFLLNRSVTLSRSRLIVYDTRYGNKLIVTYHPAAVLRDPRKMDLVREDFKLIKKTLEEA